MRRALVAAVTVPVLLLAACGSDEAPEVSEPEAPAVEQTEEPTEDPTTEEEPTEDPTTEEEPTEDPTTEEEPTEDPTTEEEPTGAATETEVPPTDGGSATEAPGGEAGSTEEGEAASARVEEFFVAMVQADPAVCDMMLNIAGDAPMNSDPAEMEICEEQIVTTLDGFFGEDTEQIQQVLEALDIAPARVEGDTARVGAEEFGELFGSGIGDTEIVLKNIDGEWYVDLNSFM